jgi:hypothetical protein
VVLLSPSQTKEKTTCKGQKRDHAHHAFASSEFVQFVFESFDVGSQAARAL